jgi:predicted RNase H-like nuclease (RuvC/YqgF family)
LSRELIIQLIENKTRGLREQYEQGIKEYEVDKAKMRKEFSTKANKHEELPQSNEILEQENKRLKQQVKSLEEEAYQLIKAVHERQTDRTEILALEKQIRKLRRTRDVLFSVLCLIIAIKLYNSLELYYGM